MKPEVRTAFIAANAANAAAQAAKAAADLLTCKPDAWALVDQAYWLCRAAQEAAQNAADALDPEKPWRTTPSFTPSSRPTTPWKKPATRRTNWSLWPKN